MFKPASVGGFGPIVRVRARLSAIVAFGSDATIAFFYEQSSALERALQAFWKTHYPNYPSLRTRSAVRGW